MKLIDALTLLKTGHAGTDAPLPVLEARLQTREGDASDATVEVLRRAYESHRALPDWAVVDAGTAEAALAGAREVLRSRIAS